MKKQDAKIGLECSKMIFAGEGVNDDNSDELAV